MNLTLREILTLSGRGMLCSYAQIFFSKDLWFGALLMLVTFLDLGGGIAGILAVLTVQATAALFNYNRLLIADGTYSYNALMVGLAVGMFYEFNLSMVVILVAASVLTFWLTLWFSASLARRSLPFLSLPFLLVVWALLLGAGNFTALELNQKTTYSLINYFPEWFEGVSRGVDHLPFRDAIHLYLRSLGAIMFQYNDLAGLLVMLGLIAYSRIAFVLSVFGFAIGFLFYQQMEGDHSQLVYSYIGFNFILTAIALGGFFVVPSRRSFVQLCFTIPIIALLISALHSLFGGVGLPLYSLPFNLVVLLFLSAMYYRSKTSGLNVVTVQQYSPEKHHYSYANNHERFQRDTYVHLILPILGEWHISQGHDGAITHRDEWKYAWDFDVADDAGSTYRMPGYTLEDYYCFRLPVLAPADGTVIKVLDGVEDNPIGGSNLKENWGNTIILQHGIGLYTKLSHLEEGSFKVSEGDVVKQGEVLALCGSSGRSPEPHLHFQVQATPYIGSHTLHYPISYYLTRQGSGYKMHGFDVPPEGAKVCNLKTTPILKETFDLVPGKILNAEGALGKKTFKEEWKVEATATNLCYLWCPETKAVAWFVNNGKVFYFTAYEGSRKTLLYQFYLAAHKVPLGYYEALTLEDQIALHQVIHPAALAVHDFTAPFFHYLKASYSFCFESSDNPHNPYEVTFTSQCEVFLAGLRRRSWAYQFHITEEGFSLQRHDESTKLNVTCVAPS